MDESSPESPAQLSYADGEHVAQQLAASFSKFIYWIAAVLRATLSICHIIVAVLCYSVEDTIALHTLIYLYLRGKVTTMIMSAQWALRMQNIEKDST